MIYVFKKKYVHSVFRTEDIIGKHNETDQQFYIYFTIEEIEVFSRNLLQIKV